MSRQYDKLLADTEKDIAHAEAFVGVYKSLEKNHILSRLHVDPMDQVHLQNVMVTIIKKINEMEKNLS